MNIDNVEIPPGAFVAVIGSRKYTRLDKVRAFVHALPLNCVLVSGAAPGVDRAAEREAVECGLPCRIYRADWDKRGKSAGYLRNIEVVENSDVIVAFWDGESKGTKHTINLAHEAEKPVYVIRA